MFCDGDFNSAWARLQCCLSKHSPNRDFLDIYLTTFPESVISEIKIYEGHLSLQNLQNYIYTSSIQQKIQKKFFVYGIIASGLVSLNCLY